LLGRRVSSLLGILLVLILLPALPAEASTSGKTVLVIYSNDRILPADVAVDGGLRESLGVQTAHGPTYINEFLDAPRFENIEYDKIVVRFFQAKYAHQPIDLVVTVGMQAFHFLLRHRSDLFKGVPVLNCGVTPDDLGRQELPPNFVGVPILVQPLPTFEVAQRLQPDAREIVIVTGTGEFDRSWEAILRRDLPRLKTSLPIRYLSGLPLDDLLGTLSRLPRNTIVYLPVFFRDSTGKTYDQPSVIRRIADASAAPVYGAYSTQIGRGIVGGYVFSMSDVGRQAGELAQRILDGKKLTPADLPTAIPSNYVFDWNQLQRWGIGMDKLPPGSTVINREYTFWELYKWRIIGLLALIVIEAILILALIRLALAQRRNLKQLTFRRELEALFAQLAAAFINLPAELVNAEIEESFQRLLEFFNLDQISLFEFSAETAQLRLLCFRTTTGVEQPPLLLDLHQLPWTASQMLRGTPIVASHLDDLPEEASELRKVMRARGVRSFLTFPLQRNENTFATLSFSTVRNEREWKPELVQSLRTITDIFGSALERKYAEEARHRGQIRLSGIIETAMDAIIAVDSHRQIVVFNTAAEKIFGCPREEALGQTLDRFIPHRFRTQHAAHISDFAESGVTKRAMGTVGALWALRANGEEFPIEASSISQVETETGKLFTVLIRDVTERKRAEEMLQRQAQALGQIHDAVITTDLEGFVTWWNAGATRMFGYAAEEALGKPVSFLYPEGQRSFLVEGIMAPLKQKGWHQTEARVRCKSGREFPIHLSLALLKNTQGDVVGMVGSSIDITEIKRVEEELRELIQKDQGALRVACMGHWEFDVATAQLAFNDQYYRLHGTTAEEAGGYLMSAEAFASRYVHPDDAHLVGEAIQQAIETNDSTFQFQTEARILRADGEPRSVAVWFRIEKDPRGRTTKLLGVSQDITERKRAEAELQRSEGKYRTLVEMTGTGYAITDAQGRILDANQEYVRLSGHRALREILGRSVIEWTAEGAKQRNAEAVAQCAKDGFIRNFVTEYVDGKGQGTFSEVNATTEGEGESLRIVALCRDVTGRQRQEQAIHELSGRLINAQEQERSRIARELHDDVNQQLAVLAIELQQLESFFPEDSSEGRQKVQALWKKTHGLSTEIQQLSHQLHSTKLEHLGIVAALRGLCTEFSAQHNIGTEFQFRQVPPTMDSDASLSLFRVAQESLHNVAKHSRAKRVRMELFGEGGKVVLRVSDDGVGFDPDARRNQTGLGMISMSERIRFVGGTLSVWSKPSMGTQVEAAIPLSRKVVAVNRISEAVSPAGKTG
jgi:PAS domain S-box-containing protein